MQMTPSSSMRLAVKAQNIQNSLSSCTTMGTTLTEAATHREASTMSIQPMGEPNRYRQIRIGTRNAPDTADPTAAVRFLNCRTPYCSTESFSFFSPFSISFSLIFCSISRQSAQSSRCSFTRARLCSLHA